MSDCNQRDYRNMHSISSYQQRFQGNMSCPCNNTKQRMNNPRYSNEYRNTDRCCPAQNTDTHCHHQTNDCMNGLPIAMGYVPWQRWHSIYEPETAMKRYTIFKELDKPFMGCRGGKGR